MAESTIKLDLSGIPDAIPKTMKLDLSGIPDANPPLVVTSDYTGPDYMPPSVENFTAIQYGTPRAPERLLRENAPELQQDLWNQTGPHPTMGPLRDKPLRPDLRMVDTTVFGLPGLGSKQLSLPNEPTGIVENLETGLRRGAAHVASNVMSLAYEVGKGAAPVYGFTDADATTRQDRYETLYKTMANVLNVDKVTPPQDFTDSLAQGFGSAMPSLIETVLLSYASAGVLNPAITGLAETFPTLAAKIAPIVRDAMTFGVQGALQPTDQAMQAGSGAAAGALLGFTAPYSRAARVMSGASIGAGQEYLSNPNATVEDYARNATIMATFAGLAASHGLTIEDTVAGTLFDWVRNKGYGPEVIRRALKMNGIGPMLNEFSDSIIAWHGSPHSFDRFNIKHIDRGEGAQTYGWGLYFAEEKSVAEFYAGLTSKEQGKVGQIYKTEIPNSEYLLDWDKQLNEQSQVVKDALTSDPFLDSLFNSDAKRQAGIKFTELAPWETRLSYLGSDLYDSLSVHFGQDKMMGKTPLEWGPIHIKNDKAASEYLNSIGIKGTKYLDKKSRTTGEGSHNYVIYDDKLIRILETKGLGLNDVSESKQIQNPEGGTEIIEFRNVGPDTSESVATTIDKIQEFARPGAMRDTWRKFEDYVSIEPVPKLARVSNLIADKAVEHASARIAAVKMVQDHLSSVFPDSYRNPEEMAKTINIIVKDNILAGWDEFNRRAEEAKKAGNDVEAEKRLEAAYAIAREHDIGAYAIEVDATRNDPIISANIERWKEYVNPTLDRLFNEMKRIDPGTDQPGRGRYFDARINLTTIRRAAELAEMMKGKDTSSPLPEAGVGTSYRNPNVKRDRFDRAAKFTGQYSTDAELVLLNVFGGRLNEVTKLRFYDSLVQAGVALELQPGEVTEAMIGGEKAVRFPIKVPSTEINPDGITRTTRMVEKSLFVRQDLAKDVRGVLGTDIPITQNPIAKILTTFQLAQIADAVSHTKNLFTVIMRAQGAGSVWKDIVRKMSVFGNLADTIGRVYEVWREVSADGPAIRKETSDMAQEGLIRPEYPPTGLQKITHAQEFIHGVDTAARVIMNRFFNDLVDRGLAVDTQANRRGYVNQVGMYNRRLQGPWMQALKDMGVAPFVVAGRNFNVQGIRSITGDPGVTAPTYGAALQLRLTNYFGTAMTLSILPMMLNTLTTGTPLGRSGTPIGAWDLGGELDEKGKHKIIDLAQIVGLRRGMRVAGLDATIEGLRNGHSAEQITSKMTEDMLSAQLHPWLGPAPAFVQKTLTGKQLDLRGIMEAQHIPEGGIRQYGEQFRAALESQNPLVYSVVRPVFQQMGMDQKPSKPYMQNINETFLKSPSSAFGVKDIYPARSAAEELAGKIAGSGFQGYAPGQKEKAELKQKIKVLERAGKPVPADLETQLETLKKKERKVLDKAQDTTQLQDSFTRLSILDAIKVLKVATPKERSDLEDIFETKAKNAIKNAADSEVDALELKIDSAREKFFN